MWYALQCTSSESPASCSVSFGSTKSTQQIHDYSTLPFSPPPPTIPHVSLPATYSFGPPPLPFLSPSPDSRLHLLLRSVAGVDALRHAAADIFVMELTNQVGGLPLLLIGGLPLPLVGALLLLLVGGLI